VGQWINYFKNQYKNKFKEIIN